MMLAPTLFEDSRTTTAEPMELSIDSMLSMSPEIQTALAENENCVVAIAISGGKDSSIAALVVVYFLLSIGFKGKIVLIHADLGSVEWQDSIKICEELAERLGIELIVVSRAAGGLMQRWLTRWENNVKRYFDLSCVKLILPWSTPSMRFCTSELKTAIICRELARRFKGKTIINVTGVRRAESDNRANAPVSKINNLLTKKDGTIGYDWNAIVEMLTPDVYRAHKYFNFRLNIAYELWKLSRVSCVFCIFSKLLDLLRSAECPDNHAIYREMCELEISSGFSFQSNLWLSDVAPHLLTAEMLERLKRAKEIQQIRENLESRIPKHLLYTKNFPECIPTIEEAVLLCKIRRGVAGLYGWQVKHTKPKSLIKRYKKLMVEKAERQARRAKKPSREVIVNNILSSKSGNIPREIVEAILYPENYRKATLFEL